ncbi:hypothetical protein K490DRAFT_34978 [Saccharata proteae CBS 121410]|uniref:Uncharacterized protein n=1 Tax=Saccharata proteae CBS 121410 TaxID=1314787 RepID=A0A9P4LX30_9PEZI|nr:hypothetical protein K490DRAFT_34978 [Saccharata proteae CBS 121410]
MDLSNWGGTNPGYVVDGCFQDINTTTREVNFQWCSLDWVPVEDTYIYLPNSGLYSNGNSGLGTEADPWDYFHINAIDKNSEGDYLVSSRYTDTIYKVAGANSPFPGSIIWYLNGVNNDFELINGLNFSRQHHVRFISTGETETTITLFDNASDGSAASANATSGMVITVNNATMTAYLARQYVNPDGLIAVSQGSVQTLANTNVFIGWGQKPYYSEFAEDGTLLYHAVYGPGLQGMMSFRTWKHDWVGTPASPPTLVAYAQACNASTYAYVSWNGATEVDHWVFLTSASADGPWEFVTQTKKQGFETQMWLTPATPVKGVYVLAEAYDGCGKRLGRSSAMRVFVPGEELAASCGATRCVDGTDYWEYGNAVVC